MKKKIVDFLAFLGDIKMEHLANIGWVQAWLFQVMVMVKNLFLQASVSLIFFVWFVSELFFFLKELGTTCHIDKNIIPLRNNKARMHYLMSNKYFTKKVLVMENKMQ